MAPTKPSVRVISPKSGDEGPKWGHVALIAGACFAVGVIWPTLAGVQLVPEVPGKKSSTEEKAAPKPEKPASPGKPSKGIPVSKTTAKTVRLEDKAHVQIEKTLTVNCRDAKGRRLNECDTPGFDTVATDRLKALTTCKGADLANGTLSLGFELDFEEQKILRILRGKSTTLDGELGDELVACAKREFMSATLKGVPHTHSRYLVFYMLRFVPAGAPITEEGGADPVVKASGSATIIWNSARIRSDPETGAVKARLLYGTKVFVSGRQGDWYRIKYDARGTEGWVHKNALAL